MPGHTIELVQLVYYTGAGLVAAGTGVRYFWKIYKERNRKDEFVEDMEAIHLPNIYSALEQMAKAQGIYLTYPHPSRKTLSED